MTGKRIKIKVIIEEDDKVVVGEWIVTENKRILAFNNMREWLDINLFFS